MAALNRYLAIGRFVADPDLKQTQNGVSVTTFTLAVDKPYNKENQHPEANFLDCVAWRGTAEFITRYFSKGKRILIEGSLQTRTYTDKNGNKRKVVEVLVDNVSFIDKREANDTTNYNTVSEYSPEEQEEPETDEDDMPF